MIYPLIITLILLVISSLLMFKKGLLSPKSRSFIITGPMGVGKTSLFHLLKGDQLPALTLTSIESSKGTLVLNDKDYHNHSTFQNVSIWDFPGNHKLKNLLMYPYLKDHLNEVIGIIYILDASSLNDEKVREICNDLVRLLQITEGKPNGVDLLILCNKCDLFTSKKKQRVKDLLQEGIKHILKMNKGGLDKVDDEDNEQTFIGGDNFQFQFLEGNVTFEEANIWKDNKRNSVLEWVLEKVVNT